MINEEKLRGKLAKILKKPLYKGLHTFAVKPLIEAVVEACKDSEIEKVEAELITKV